MQCGPVRHRVDAKAQAAARLFEHTVIVRPTTFQAGAATGTDKRIEFQSLYQPLVDDEARNRTICDEVVQAVRDGRSPLILTERNEHLDRFEDVLSTRVRHVVVLRGGTGKKQRRAEAERLAAVPREEGRVILATGKYIGEGFDDPRLDTLFLTLQSRGRGPLLSTSGGCIASTMASVRYGSTTTPT
jgi:superfamily II DNA or RNA helicase